MRISDWSSDVCSSDLAINAGLRYEDTDYTSSGASKTVISAKPRLDENGDPTGQNDIVVSDIIPVSFHGKYRDWLPSLNVRPDVPDNLGLRFRSEERRVGQECVSTCGSRWCPYN